jgi:uncharacterized protein
VIIETIVTTLDAEGAVNVAPMGVEWYDDRLVVKPFLDTTTFRNLRDTRCAVVNLTDDVRIFVRAALLNTPAPTVPATVVRGVILDAACSWREVEVMSIDATPPRSRIDTRVVHRGQRAEFLGFNRARHAVLEATILATRLHLVSHAEIRKQIDALAVLVEKTAGPREHEAWSLVSGYLHERLT